LWEGNDKELFHLSSHEATECRHENSKRNQKILSNKNKKEPVRQPKAWHPKLAMALYTSEAGIIPFGWTSVPPLVRRKSSKVFLFFLVSVSSLKMPMNASPNKQQKQRKEGRQAKGSVQQCETIRNGDTGKKE